MTKLCCIKLNEKYAVCIYASMKQYLTIFIVVSCYKDS